MVTLKKEQPREGVETAENDGTRGEQLVVGGGGGGGVELA